MAIIKLPFTTKNLGPTFANSIDGVFDLFDKIILPNLYEKSSIAPPVVIPKC